MRARVSTASRGRSSIDETGRSETGRAVSTVVVTAASTPVLVVVEASVPPSSRTQVFQAATATTTTIIDTIERVRLDTATP